MREVGNNSIFCFYSRAEQGRVKKLHFLQPGGVVTVAFQAPGAVKLVAPMLKAQPGTWEFRAVLSYKATSGPVHEALCQKNGMVWLAEPIKTLPCLASPVTGSIA